MTVKWTSYGDFSLVKTKAGLLINKTEREARRCRNGRFTELSCELLCLRLLSAVSCSGSSGLAHMEMIKEFQGINGTSTRWPGYLQKVLCNDSAVHLRDHMAQLAFRPASLSFSPCLCVSSQSWQPLTQGQPYHPSGSRRRTRQRSLAGASVWTVAGFFPAWLVRLSSRLLPAEALPCCTAVSRHRFYLSQSASCKSQQAQTLKTCMRRFYGLMVMIRPGVQKHESII